MIKIPIEMIYEKIKEQKGLSDADIDAKVKEKLDQLSGLISKEGAAHIIANELGVKVYEEGGKVQIKNILPGMRNVDIVGKVTRVFEIREFQKEDRTGKVGSFMIGDETGNIRVVAWNDKTDLMTNLSENDVINIKGGYARENNRGLREIHLGDKSSIEINPKGAPKIETKQQVRTRKNIADLSENDNDVEILGTIVQVFDPRFFSVCPECGKRARDTEGKYMCNEHGEVTPTYSYVLNIFLDDGTENVRAVMWRNQIQKLLGKTHEEILAIKDEPFDDIKNQMLGKIVKLVGRTSKNEMFDRIEFIPQLVFLDPDPGEELQRLEKSPEQKAPPKPAESKPTEEATPKTSTSDDVEILSLEDLEQL